MSRTFIVEGVVKRITEQTVKFHVNSDTKGAIYSIPNEKLVKEALDSGKKVEEALLKSEPRLEFAILYVQEVSTSGTKVLNFPSERVKNNGS